MFFFQNFILFLIQSSLTLFKLANLRSASKPVQQFPNMVAVEQSNGPTNQYLKKPTMREADIRDRAKNRKERRRERFNRSNSEERKRKRETADEKVVPRKKQKEREPSQHVFDLQEEYLQTIDNQREILTRLHNRLILEDRSKRTDNLKRIVSETIKKQRILKDNMFVKFNQVAYKGMDYETQDSEIIRKIKYIVYEFDNQII